MNFDRWWPQDDDGTATADAPFVPDGEHVAKIVGVEWKDLKFKVEDRNPDGTCLVVKLEVTGFQRIEDLVPVHWRGKIEAVCRAASQPVPVRGEEWDEKTLVGQFVRISTVQGVAKSGREYVRIDTWIPGREPVPEAIRKAPKRAATKARPEGGEDDIPF
jgi:hypothetical protein